MVVYIYEILEAYIGEMPNLMNNWMFEKRKLIGDTGDGEFILHGLDKDKGCEVPMFRLRRHGYIRSVTVDELLKELSKGREYGTAFLESHNITVPQMM